TYASIVEPSKTVAPNDKAFLAFVAAAEKQAASYRAQIDQRRAGVKISTHRESVEQAATTAIERMKALEGEPAPVAFEAADKAVGELERALEPSFELGPSDRS